MSEKQIDPADIKVGDRIRVSYSRLGIDRTYTLTVADVDLESMVVKSVDSDWVLIRPIGFDSITLLHRPLVPSFDPAAVWPRRDLGDEPCLEMKSDYECTRHRGHDGLHAAHTLMSDNPVYVWGDPR